MDRSGVTGNLLLEQSERDDKEAKSGDSTEAAGLNSTIPTEKPVTGKTARKGRKVSPKKGWEARTDRELLSILDTVLIQCQKRLSLDCRRLLGNGYYAVVMPASIGICKNCHHFRFTEDFTGDGCRYCKEQADVTVKPNSP